MSISISDIAPAMQRQAMEKYFAAGGAIHQKKSKYGNRKVIWCGVKFDSERELARYKELLLMQRAGAIQDIRRQVPYVLHEASKTVVNGKVVKRRGMKYIADFVYIDCATGAEVVEDAKGHRTDVYKRKKRLMKQIYNIEIAEV